MKPVSAAENGVVGLPENRSALRAVRQVAHALERSKRAPSPLFLYGVPGTGKTTLVTTMVRMVLESPRGHTVQVIAANDIDSRPDEDTEDGIDGAFSDLGECDLLVIEDAQHLPGRSADLVGRILDHRTQCRRPTVLTANAGPAGLGLPHRLSSRLAAGLVVPLPAFSPPSRSKLLTYHADRLQLKLDPDAIRWLANRPSGGGFRPLLGFLNTLKAGVRNPLAVLTREEVADRLAADASPQADVAAVVRAVAGTFGVTPKELLGPSRLKTILLARQTAMYLARSTAKLSLPALGREFGRDHSTVLHAIRKVEGLLATDAGYAGTLNGLRTSLA